MVHTNFPSVPNQTAVYQQAFQSLLAKSLTISLDRLESALATLEAQKQSNSVAMENPVPNFVFSKRPAVLVTIDGDPVWRAIEGTPYQRVLNTRPLLLRDSSSYYFHIFDGFLNAQVLAGPWSFNASVPSGIAKAATDLAAIGEIDLMVGPVNEKSGNTPSLSSRVPDVIVVTTPTELIVTDGNPDWVPLEGTTSLLYIKNTDANVFFDRTTQQYYVLVSGRWFTCKGQNQPWYHVDAKELPVAFTRIPDDSTKENVKASIPGTKQAKEAIIAAQIPQMAHVSRAKATFSPAPFGSPEIKPIERTSLQYVLNSPLPLIQAPDGTWFGLQRAVWFTAPTLQGPWSVATTVAAEIYAIPPSSSLYYTTFVRIYDVTPTTVTAGYLPGYVGTYVSSGTLVYGTGYIYKPYIGAYTWYGAPVTYGYAANLSWTPWTGWAVGFGMGWGYGAAWGAAGAWGWGAAPYWGPYAGVAWGANGAYGVWGPGGWAASSGNVYHQWGNNLAVSRSSAGYNAWTGNAWSGETARSYNSQTGRISAGQRGTVENVYSGNYASGARASTYNPQTGVSASGAHGTIGNQYTGQSTNVSRANVTGPGGNEVRAANVGNDHYVDVNGNVYKDTGSGWEKHDSSGGWSSAGWDDERSLNSEQEMRNIGARRSAASSYGGGERSFGNGFRGGGSEPDFRGGTGLDRGGFGDGARFSQGGFRGGRR